MRGGRGITASARRRLSLGASAARVPLLLSPPLCLFLPSASASGLLFLPALIGGRQAPAGKQEPPAEQRGRGAAAGCGRLLGVGRLLPAPGSRLQPVPAAWVCRVGLRLSPVRLVLALIRSLPGFSEGGRKCSHAAPVLPALPGGHAAERFLMVAPLRWVGAHTSSDGAPEAPPLCFGNEELTCPRQAEDVVPPAEAPCLPGECAVSSPGCSGGMRLHGLATGVPALWLAFRL